MDAISLALAILVNSGDAQRWPVCPQWYTPAPWTVLKKQEITTEGETYTEYVYDRDHDGEWDLAALFPLHGVYPLTPRHVLVETEGDMLQYDDIRGAGYCEDYIDSTNKRRTGR